MQPFFFFFQWLAPAQLCDRVPAGLFPVYVCLEGEQRWAASSRASALRRGVWGRRAVGKARLGGTRLGRL